MQNDFSRGSVSGNIIRLAVPLMLAQLVNVLYNVVDRVFIGHIGNSALPLTGVGLCMPVITVISAFSGLFGMGGAPFCSMARGRGDIQEAEQVQNTSFVLLVGCGLLLTILGELFLHPILTLFGASAETMPYATSYLRIYLVGTIFVMIALGMNYFINTQGFAGIGMLTVSIGAVLNLILDPLFIFVLDMGVAGAALATICSQAVSALWALGFLFSKRALLRLRPHAFRWEWHRIRRIIGLGMSNFIAMGTNGVVQIACNSTAQAFGGNQYGHNTDVEIAAEGLCGRVAGNLHDTVGTHCDEVAHAEADDPANAMPFPAECMGTQTQKCTFAEQEAECPESGDRLRADGSQCSTGNTHVKHEDKQRIEDQIEYSTDGNGRRTRSRQSPGC